MPYPMNALRLAEDVRLEKDGQLTRRMRATFYLGNHGPFTEYFDRETYTLADLEVRADALRRHIPPPPL